MQVQQIIQASADVLTITRLSPGNVYKRVDEDYNGAPTLKFGVVQDMMNNGSDAAVTALEYEADYGSGAKATLRGFTGSKPAAIFPATPDEVRAHVDGLLESTERAVREAEEALSRKREALAAVQRMHAHLGDLSPAEAEPGAIEAS